MNPSTAVRTQREKGRFALHFSLLLRLARADASAKERLAHFFLERFSDAPEEFSSFLHHLKSHLGEGERHALASQYLAVLSPLAEHFGMFRLKRGLDTVCFSIVFPQEYARIQDALRRYERDSAQTLRRITRLLKATLQPDHACVIRGRFKEPYSVHKKLREKSYRDLVALHDLFGFRIILPANQPRECFDVLHKLHDRFLPVVGRFKDYVSIPKINGYQSLHTTLLKVLPDLDVPIEVQIRTQFMHDFSQAGLSSHWLYKKKGGPMLTAEQRALLHHVTSLSQFAGRQQHVYCLAGGELLRLPPGATPIDAARALGIGLRRMTCSVNGERRDNLDFALRDGDEIDFLRESDIHAKLPRTKS